MNRPTRFGFGKSILLALFSILALTRLTHGAEDVAFFEKKYQTKISGVKPIDEYDDPDKFYTEIAKQLGIPKLGMEAAAAKFGWKKDDGKWAGAMVGRTPGQWQVMISRVAVSPDTKRPNLATMEVKMVCIDDDKKITFIDKEHLPALDAAQKHVGHYLGGQPQKLADTYAEKITLLPGHAMLNPKHGLAGPKGMDEAVTVERAALIKKLEPLIGGRALLTPGQQEDYFNRAKMEVLEAAAGNFAADPPKPVNTPDGKLHFSIQQGDVLVKVGDPARHFTLLQLRNKGGAWRVVAESKP